MTSIELADAQAWIEPTKLTLSTIDANLESQITTQIFARLPSASFTTTAWVTPATTPAIVRTTIAMYYVAWMYDKYYSDDAEANAYAELLRQYADLNIAGLIAGSIELEEGPGVVTDAGSPSFFPTDESSRNQPTVDNPSDGPPAFTMGTVF
jgi:hypothetical protein